MELQLNGTAIGRKKLNARQMAKFSVVWQLGELTTIAYGDNNHEIARTSLHSAGKATQLRLEPEQPIVKPDELCYVRLRYTDENGMTKPLVHDTMKVIVTGGKLLGLGNACSYNVRGYLTDETDSYYGEALAIIQPDGVGIISVKADSSCGCGCVQVSCKEDVL